MYAVFRTGGKQYRARQGERVRVEKLEADVGGAVESISDSTAPFAFHVPRQFNVTLTVPTPESMSEVRTVTVMSHAPGKPSGAPVTT